MLGLSAVGATLDPEAPRDISDRAFPAETDGVDDAQRSWSACSASMRPDCVGTANELIGLKFFLLQGAKGLVCVLVHRP
jgi:hypothetical protein